MACNIVIPNIEICADEGSLGATCAYTETSQTEDIPLAVWNIERFGQLCMSATSYGSLKATIEKLCHETKNCKYSNTADSSLTSLLQKVNSKN